MNADIKLDIRQLTPDLLTDYLAFFDNTPHDDEIDEHKCYCVCWSDADCEGRDDTTAESRRALAAEYVARGHIRGYLAYEGGRVVGWCSANTRADCVRSRGGRMYLSPIVEADPENGARIKSVFCFVIAPDMRRKGVSGALLRRVIEDAKQEGFDVVEAYPLKAFTSVQYDFSGPMTIYERHGFQTHRDLGDRAVMRLGL